MEGLAEVKEDMRRDLKLDDESNVDKKEEMKRVCQE